LLPDSPSLALFDGPIENVMAVKELNGFGSYITLEGDFDGYFRSLGRNFRRNLTKAQNRIRRSFSQEPQSEFTTGFDPDRFNAFIELEASGWKGRRGTAIRCEQANLNFYRALTERLAASGWLEWHFLKLQGRPIAGHLAVRLGSKLLLPKIAFDETYAHLSPGNILLLSLLERLFQEGNVQELDLLTDMSWHANWNSRKRPYYDVQVFPKSLFSLLSGYLPLRTRQLLGNNRLLGPALRKVRYALRRCRNE
jgi:hypothetical protein